MNAKSGYCLSCEKESGKDPNDLTAIIYNEGNTIFVYSFNDEIKDMHNNY